MTTAPKKLLDPKTAPRDGTKILGYGRWGWEGLTDDREPHLLVCIHGKNKQEWNDETEQYEDVDYFESVTNNPYADYCVLLGWLPLPEVEL